MVTPQGHSGRGTAAGTAQWTHCHRALRATVPAPEVLTLSLVVHVLSRLNQLSKCICSLFNQELGKESFPLQRLGLKVFCLLHRLMRWSIPPNELPSTEHTVVILENSTLSLSGSCYLYHLNSCSLY